MPEHNTRELDHTRDWEGISKFALDLIEESRLSQSHTFIDERIAILHLDHATELLMKAFLIKEGYFIEPINLKKVREGLTKDTKIESLLRKDRTIDYMDCLDIVSKKINLSPNEKAKIKEFHNIRNNIQHKGLNIPLNKGEKIVEFSPLLEKMYGNMFPDSINKINEILGVFKTG